MKMKKTLILGTLICLLLTGCNIWISKPTEKNYRRVLKMNELTPITVEQLRQLIASDSTHYKVVVLTSSCCGYCGINMRDVYPKKMAECDSSLVHWYFVEVDYSSAQYMDMVFKASHIDSPRYWINDTLPQYRPLMMKNMWSVVWNVFRHDGESHAELGCDVAEDRLNNIANAIAPQKQPITSVDGVPTTLMLDPQGRMKCTIVIDESGAKSFGPTDIRDITVPVTELDYSKVDTLSHTPTPEVCTPDGKCN